MARHFVTNADVRHDDFPWCHVEWMSDAQLVGAEQLMLVRATFGHGAGHNFHRHPSREEIIYVLSGQAEQWVGEDRRVLGPGDMAHVPRDTPHATYNVGPGELRFLAVLGPVNAPEPFTVDVFNEEPWKTLRPPLFPKKKDA